jgi:signal transduction histidine kinase
VVVQRIAREVVTTVEDDGPGFDVAAALNQPPGKRRLGIFGMQERARLAGGTLSIESEPAKALPSSCGCPWRRLTFFSRPVSHPLPPLSSE